MKKAFTLAEVLLTLAIIGIVSAVTLPSLQTNVRKQGQIAQIKKAYNTVSEAAKLCMADKGVDSFSEAVRNGTELEAFAENYFQIAKDCGEDYYNAKAECFVEEYHAISGANVFKVTKEDGTKRKCNKSVTLNDGTAMCFWYNTATEDNGIPESNVVSIYVDINGAKGPNIGGRDLFVMDINEKGRVWDIRCPDDAKCQVGDGAHEITYAGPMGIGVLIESDWEMNY